MTQDSRRAFTNTTTQTYASRLQLYIEDRVAAIYTKIGTAVKIGKKETLDKHQ